MGRHRRSAAGRAATGRAADITESYSPSTPSAPSAAYPPRSARSLYFPEEPSPYDFPQEPSPYNTPQEPSRYDFPQEPAQYDAYAQYFRDAPAAAFPEQRETETAVYGSISSAGGSGQVPRGRSRRRAKRSGVPVRTGLLGASAAVAMGAVAVASGLIPGADSYKLGGDHDGDKVQAAVSPTVEAQGGTDGPVYDDRAPSAPSRATERATPSARPSKPAPAKPSAKPSKKPAPSRTSAAGGGAATTTKSATPAPEAPEKTQAPTTAAPTTSAADTAAAQVLALVNQERSKVGCSPVTADSGLAALATAFSEDMAARGFFDHTDPDGATPWDRAEKAGVSDLGGENIARGQGDAAAVMEAWMNSPGHKANILNCDYKTLGVGVHFGSGGPWWTQDFGF
ncbi:CAP domain-containing protein [Streptomyces sp. NPDC016845]|uniref:CAP domain-containing protein n=1 Tax=Streptomyces sp. NPDC016845 TaxID=3364972 RepID=UPI00379AB04E